MRAKVRVMLPSGHVITAYQIPAKALATTPKTNTGISKSVDIDTPYTSIT
jgi:hypothetical protein